MEQREPPKEVFEARRKVQRDKFIQMRRNMLRVIQRPDALLSWALIGVMESVLMGIIAGFIVHRH
jgi:hypothetical protein